MLASCSCAALRKPYRNFLFFMACFPDDAVFLNERMRIRQLFVLSILPVAGDA